MKFSVSSLYDGYRNLLRNPKYRIWVIAGTLFYLLSPFDLLPDVFPIVGQIDDGILIALFLAEISSLLIESFKARKGGDVRDENSTPKPDSNPDTIDVDAVSIK